MHKARPKLLKEETGESEHTFLTAVAQEWTYVLVLLWVCSLGSLAWLKINGDLTSGVDSY